MTPKAVIENRDYHLLETVPLLSGQEKFVLCEDSDGNRFVCPEDFWLRHTPTPEEAAPVRADSTSQEKIDYLVTMRNSGRNRVQDYADKFGVEFHPGEKPWGVKADVIMPSAMQNDVNMEQAKRIVANGIKYYIEVANMPTTNDALKFLMEQPNMIVAPSKAVNAGGVAVSALEMSQNSERLVWSAEEVDEKLKGIMKTIHDMSVEAAEEYGLGYNLVAGANIAGFKKVATAMMEQGIF